MSLSANVSTEVSHRSGPSDPGGEWKDPAERDAAGPHRASELHREFARFTERDLGGGGRRMGGESRRKTDHFRMLLLVLYIQIHSTCGRFLVRAFCVHRTRTCIQNAEPSALSTHVVPSSWQELWDEKDGKDRVEVCSLMNTPS